MNNKRRRGRKKKKIFLKKKIEFFNENKGIKIFCITLIAMISFYIIYSIRMDYITPYSSNAVVEYDVIPVYSRVNGIIKSINVKNSDIVKKGDKLFDIESEQYRILYELAVANKESAERHIDTMDKEISVEKAQIEKAQKNLDTLSKEHEKYKMLFEKEMISEDMYDDIKIKYDNAKNDYEIAKRQLKQLEVSKGKEGSDNDLIKVSDSQISKAKLDLEYTEIISPINGIVEMKQLYSGNAVNTSVPLLYIINKDELKISVETKEKTINAIKNSDLILVVFDAYPNKIFHAKLVDITKISSSSYTKPGNLEDVEQIDNKVVRPQGFGKVNIKITDKIPENYDIMGGGKASVLFFSKDVGKPMKLFGKIWIKAVQLFKYIQ